MLSKPAPLYRNVSFGYCFWMPVNEMMTSSVDSSASEKTMPFTVDQSVFFQMYLPLQLVSHHTITPFGISLHQFFSSRAHS